MKSVLFAAALASAASAQLMINTPTDNAAAECQPFLITWSGGTPNYIVTIQTNPVGTTPVASFLDLSGTSVTWPAVNATAGSSLLFQIKDSTGAPATSAPFTVATGSGDSCIGTGGTTSGGSSAGSSDTTAGATSATDASAAGGSSTTAKASNSPTTSTKPSASASGSTKPSAATAVAVPAGVLPAVVAILGSALIALLA